METMGPIKLSPVFFCLNYSPWPNCVSRSGGIKSTWSIVSSQGRGHLLVPSILCIASIHQLAAVFICRCTERFDPIALYAVSTNGMNRLTSMFETPDRLKQPGLMKTSLPETRKGVDSRYLYRKSQQRWSFFVKMSETML